MLARDMSATASLGPLVGDDDAVLQLPDGRRALASVALAHELRRPRRLPFERTGRRWELRLPRPEADRIEYLLELEHHDGRTELIPDPQNPLRARGPFGEKSVLEFPGYEAPLWIDDEDVQPGELRELPIESRRLRTTLGAFLWSAADTDPQRPLPLLVVHDGPEYAEYSSLLRLLDHLVDFGEVPELRAVLLPPPPDRNEAYSASARYANACAAELLPRLREQAPTDRPPVLMGASLGALAALHAHWLHPGLAAGLFLQSGSYFRQRFDRHESGFSRFNRMTRFVGQVHRGRGFPTPAATTITCGTVEENLENNRAVATALAKQGWPVETVWNRDAHNWVAWRDALHPHLAELLLRAWT
jgi:enterochelin esterase-like enzyme